MDLSRSTSAVVALPPRHLRRTVPSMSAAEHLERLKYDVDTVLQLQLRSYSDEAWLPVADALVEYGMGVITGWLRSGQIFAEVARTGYGAIPRCPASWLDNDTIESLAGETITRALNYFKFKVLMKGKWNPARGASLTTFFIGQCKFQFANVYKVWHNAEADHHGLVSLDHRPEAAPPAADDPARELLATDGTEALLDQLSTSLARQVFSKKFVDGASYEEIVATTPGIKDVKAAQNLVFRERRRLQP